MKRKDLKYRTNEYTHYVQQYTIWSFGDKICTDKININKTEIDQTNLLENIMDFNDRFRPKRAEGKNKKILMKVYMLFIKVEK